MRLRAFFESFYRPLRLVGCSEKSTEQYRLAIARFGDVPMTKLSDVMLGQFAERRLQEGVEAATVNKELRHIKALWRFAKRQRLVSMLPDFPNLKEPRRLPRAWTVAEISLILRSCREEVGKIGEAAAGLFWCALVLTLFDTGLRKSAVLQCRTKDFVPTQRRLWVRAGTQKHRTEQVFSLSDETTEAIGLIYNPDRDLLFPWDRDGFRGSQWRSLNRHFRRILTRAGLPTDCKYFHRFRATHASYIELIQPGAAQAHLGHSSPAITRRSYLDPLIVSQSRLVDRLPRP